MRRGLVHPRRLLGALLVVVAGASSCSRPKGPPPPPDFTSAQRAVWQRVPDDALGALVVADVGHLLGRLRALHQVLATGAATKGYLDRWQATATGALGFDPLDAQGWRDAGLDPDGPLAVVLGPEHQGLVLFKASDAQKATATARRFYQAGGASEPFDCAPAGALFRCGSPGWALPDAPAASLWPHVEKNLPATHQAMELVVYAPLDQGPAREAIEREHTPIGGLHAAYLGLTATPERLLFRLGARVDDARRVLPYLAPRAGASLLGLAGGGVSAGRITFSPDALWALAKEKLGALSGEQAGMFQAVAGFDLDKDVIENLTGEIVFAGYRGDRKAGPDGKPIPYAERVGSVAAFGTRDDARSRRVADRIGEGMAGMMGTFAELEKTFGMRSTYRSEGTDRKVHWFGTTFSGETLKVVGVPQIEFFLTTAPGAVLVGMSQVGLDEARRRIGQKPSTFLDQLPLPEERRLFEKSPLVFWSVVGEGFATQMRAQAAKNVLEAVSPDAAKVMTELIELGQLVYDAVAAVELDAERADLFYQATFL